MYSTLRTFSQEIIQKNILFDYDQSDISEESRMAINEIYDKIEGASEYSISIIGHTDQDGGELYNLELSKQRAISVQNQLLDLGISKKDISIDFKGEQILLSEAQKLKAKNRRVELSATIYNYSSVNDFVEQIQKDQVHRIKINNKEEVKYNLPHGTSVSIPANAFCYADGTAAQDGEIQINIKEVFSYVDMVDNFLFTQTSDQMLETGGMIYIEAMQDDQILQLKDGASIELKFPPQKLKKGMELFVAAEDEGDILWEATGMDVTNELEKDDLFLQVDLSPILNFKSNLDEISIQTTEEMPPYPISLRKPNPPFKGNYTPEKFEIAQKKYLEAKERYDNNQKGLSEKREAWIKEVYKRREILAAHREYEITSRIQGRLFRAIEHVRNNQDKISHHKLINGTFAFLQRQIGRIKYDKAHYAKLVYGNSLQDALKYTNLEFPLYHHKIFASFCGDFNSKLNEVNTSIAEKKYEMGYIDKDILSRYVLNTPTLGWINCDRFIQLPEASKTNLEFVNNDMDIEYYLIFKNIQSLLRPKRLKNKIAFSNIPKNENVRLVAIKTKNNKAFAASIDMNSSSKNKLKFDFKETKIQGIKKLLSTS